MSLEIFIAMVIFTFVSSVTPGPNNLMLLASGVNFGLRRTVPHMLGVAIGFIVLLLAVGAGMGSLLTAIPPLYTALKIAGGLYLLYLAFRIATAGPVDTSAANAAKPLTFLEAAAFQWFNPKGWVMAVTAMATYTVPTNYWLTMLVVALTFGLISVPSVSAWAGLGVVLRRWLSDPRRLRIFNIAMAVLLVFSLWPLLR